MKLAQGTIINQLFLDMRTITSIKKAIQYFAFNQEVKEYEYKGEKHYKYIPPKDFHRMTITHNDGITFIYESFRWLNYVSILQDESITKIRLTIKED